MTKLVAFLKAKAGLDRAAFMDYYETRHARLLVSMMPELIGYRRNYLDPPVAGFDAVTELRFPDRASYEAKMERLTDPATFARIAADEDNFLDRTATALSIAEEHGDLG